jgi:hypothetical protein
MKYILKKEFLFKTINIKKHSTSIQYKMWNIKDNQKISKYLYENGYAYMFDILSSEEEKSLSKENIESSEETFHDLILKNDTDCGTCNKKKGRKKKISKENE